MQCRITRQLKYSIISQWNNFSSLHLKNHVSSYVILPSQIVGIKYKFKSSYFSNVSTNPMISLEQHFLNG